MKEGKKENLAGIVPPPVIVFALAVIAMGLQWYHPLSVQSPYRAWALFAGIFLVAASGLLAFYALRIMRVHRTPVHFKAPPTVILKDGPFKHTRNPLYLSLLIFYGGIGLIVNSLWFLLLSVVLYLFVFSVILREEAYLEHVYGAEYLSYKNTVRRWF